MKGLLGEIKTFAIVHPLEDWVDCDGRLLDKNDHPKLFDLIGFTYGGDGDTKFAIPDLRGRIPVGTGRFRNGHVLDSDGLPKLNPNSEHKYKDPYIINYDYFNLGDKGGTNTSKMEIEHMPPHQHNVTIDVSEEDAEENSPTLILAKSELYRVEASEDQYLGGVESSSAGSGVPFNNNAPTIGLRYCISINEEEEEEEEEELKGMLGEVRLFAGNTPPEGWKICKGQLLSISNYNYDTKALDLTYSGSALFSLFGTQYSGDGRRTFGLPNFRCNTGIGFYWEGNNKRTMYIQTPGKKVATSMLRFWSDPDPEGAGRLSVGPRFKYITSMNIPYHKHDFRIKVSTDPAEESSPTGVLAQGNFYNEPSERSYNNPKLGGVVCERVGGGPLKVYDLSGSDSPPFPIKKYSKNQKSISNYQPYLVVNYIICVKGIYPSRAYW